MESDGLVRIFKCSEKEYGFRYVRYLDDGDSKSFSEVSKANVYKDAAMVKEECCGHIQRRMEKKLMNVKSECKGKSFVVDAKGIMLRRIKPNTKLGEKIVRGISGSG